jgi:hypothetical protein
LGRNLNDVGSSVWRAGGEEEEPDGAIDDGLRFDPGVALRVSEDGSCRMVAHGAENRPDGDALKARLKAAAWGSDEEMVWGERAL